MTSIRERIGQTILDLIDERECAEDATRRIGISWHIEHLTGIVTDTGTLVANCAWQSIAGHVVLQDPAHTIKRIDRELAACRADLALLDWAERPTPEGTVTPEAAAFSLSRMRVRDNLNARYPGATK
jgi:hypothetical protein